MALLVAIFLQAPQASVLIHAGVRPEALTAKGETSFDVCGVLVHYPLGVQRSWLRRKSDSEATALGAYQGKRAFAKGKVSGCR